MSLSLGDSSEKKDREDRRAKRNETESLMMVSMMLVVTGFILASIPIEEVIFYILSLFQD